MASEDPRPSRYQHRSPQAQSMLALGESGRYEFKQTAEAVNSKLLAALANWVALQDDTSVAHLMVGVQEIEERTSGLVSGQPCGLKNGLDRAVARIQDVATNTRPIPVDVFIVEEAVAESTPFLRVEVRPTMAPHFDDEGRRQTRQGRSTRAMTDDELLAVYLRREAGTFASRFQQVSEALHAAVGGVGVQLDTIAQSIDVQVSGPLRQAISVAEEAGELAASAQHAASSAEGAASSAEDAARMVSSDVLDVEHLVRELQDVVESLSDQTPEALAYRLSKRRQVIWLQFAVDTWERNSPRAEKLAQELRALLSGGIPADVARNTIEMACWATAYEDRQNQRGRRGTLRWWESTILTVRESIESMTYVGPDLPDLRSELQTDFDKALDNPESIIRRFDDQLQGHGLGGRR